MAQVEFHEVASLAKRLGFGLCGVTAARPSDHGDHARQWIADGKHGEMAYLAEHMELRLDPQKLLPGAASVIAVTDAYVDHESGEKEAGGAERGPRGKVARYAWGRDYHKVIKKRLHTLCDALKETHPQAQFRATVDTAPAFEREHAARAGLGWTGKHTLLIHPRHGSFFLLGLVLTTLKIEPPEIQPPETDAHAGASSPKKLPEAERKLPGVPGGADDHCANCTRCIDACPTGAIDPAGYTLDARRCISYLTLEHRSTITPELHASMGSWVGGCDVCQEVCPYNVVAKKAGNALPVLADYAPRAHAEGFDLLAVLGWSEQDRLRHTAGTALTRIKLPMWKRNALIASGNALADRDDAALRKAVERCGSDGDAVVRATVEQVRAGNG